LPLGLNAQTSLGLILLGRASRTVFARTGFLGGAVAGEVWYSGGVLFALILWAFAFVWFVWALCSICAGKFPFSMGWWAFTFPIGVLATSTIQLGREFDSVVFNVLGSIFAFGVTAVWLLVFVKTLTRFISGEFFR